MASKISCRAKKSRTEKAAQRDGFGRRRRGSSSMNEKKPQNNGVAFSVLGPDAFLHRQHGMGSSG